MTIYACTIVDQQTKLLDELSIFPQPLTEEDLDQIDILTLDPEFCAEVTRLQNSRLRDRSSMPRLDPLGLDWLERQAFSASARMKP